jgi:hypothetical protein
VILSVVYLLVRQLLAVLFDRSEASKKIEILVLRQETRRLPLRLDVRPGGDQDAGRTERPDVVSGYACRHGSAVPEGADGPRSSR